MSEIGIDEFTDEELGLLEEAYGTSSHGQEIKRLVAEIRRLRVENGRWQAQNLDLQRGMRVMAEEMAAKQRKIEGLTPLEEGE